jgi:hypothetical protein
MNSMSAFDPEYRLPDAERARLRPSVDVPSLERLLAHVPAEVRPLLLSYCRHDTSAAEHAAAMAPFAGEEAPRPATGELHFQRPRFLEPHLATLWRAAAPDLAR